MNYEFSILDKSHDKSNFSCGIDSLDAYIKTRASQDKKKKVAVTYVLHEKDNSVIVGYYTLSSTAIDLEAIPKEIQKKLPKYPDLPATLIGRLAIDKTYQDKHLGQYILVDALKRSYNVSIQVASYAVVVEAINAAAEKFYRKYGFLDLSSNSSKLFIPMNDVEKLFR